MDSQNYGSFDKAILDANKIVTGFSQDVPLPVKILGAASKVFTVFAIVVLFREPNSHGLVNAAWFYIFAQFLCFVVESALGFTNGLRQNKVFQLTF